MIRFEPKFAFLGGRDYVHGPSMFSCFHQQLLAAVGDGALDVTVSRFRVNCLVRQNYAAYVRGPDHRATEVPSQPLVEMSCDIRGARWTAVLADEPTGPVTIHEDSHEKDFVASVERSGPFAGSADLIRLSDNESLVQGAVEANKQLHLATMASFRPDHVAKFRFAYCLNYVCPARLPADTGRITIRNLGIQATDTHTFTLNQVELRLGDWRSGFRLCFATDDPIARALIAAGGTA